MLAQKSNKQHDLISNRIYCRMDLIKDEHVNGLMLPDGSADGENYYGDNSGKQQK